MSYSSLHKVFIPFAFCLLLAGCGSYRSVDSTPSTGGHYKVGQPYQIKDKWYYPSEDYSYDETGIASWYGADFHDHKTANGEIYNKDELTAAHKTLPLPCLARVTNLDNGRSIVVRVNDRGPFSGSRIIDMSQRSAQLLGFENQGTAKVRVQVLADESKAIADAMRRYGSPASASPAPIVMASASPEPEVEREELKPVYSTQESRRELMKVRPVAQYVQLPVTGRTKLYVQAGAFTVNENAQKLQKRLASYGPANISKVDINGKRFYRVRLGPVANVPKADALLHKVRQAGITEARTVVD